MVCLLVQGCSYEEIGRQVDRTQMTVHKNLKRMGFSGPGRNAGGNPFYAFGQRIDARLVAHLVRALALPPIHAANYLGIHRHNLYTYRGHQHAHVATRLAKQIAERRERLIFHLMSSSAKQSNRRGQSRVLATFFPDLKKKTSLLTTVLRKCRQFLRSNPSATHDDLGEWLCQQAQDETSQKNKQRTFTSFLPWAPEVIPNLDVIRLRGSTYPHRVAQMTIASRWRTTEAVIHEAFLAKPIPPSEMPLLIHGVPTPTNGAGETKPKKRRGASPKKETEKTYYKIGADVEKRIPVALKNDKHSIVTARRLVSDSTDLEFDAVAEYHRKYRQFSAKTQ